MFLEFEKISLKERKKVFYRQLEKSYKALKKLVKQKKKTFSTFALPLWMVNERLGWAFHPLSHLNSVQNSPKIQKIYTQALDELTQYYTQMMQDERIYAAFVAIRDQEYSTLTFDQKKGIDDMILDFSLSGVGFARKIKKRLASIDLELGRLTTQFSQNVLDDTNAFSLIVDESDIKGLPSLDQQSAKMEENGEVQYRFTLKYPSYIAYMTYGENRCIREKLYKAYVTRGEKNALLIDQILALRHEKAKMLGFETFADLSVATKDALNSSSVIKFLEELSEVSLPFAQQEAQELRDYAHSCGFDDLQSFDVAYISEKMRKELYDIDEELYRPYFEKNRVVEGMMNFVASLFDITIHKITTKTWDKKVMVYELSRDGAPFGRLYLDLEARDEKKGGAWMDNWTSYCVDEKGEAILPIVFVVCNFPPSSKTTPSLLKHSDVETLFHEMGHAIHHLFSVVPTVVTSGVNGVCWDVVEFPSQFLENFVFDPEVLQTFASHYQTGEVISPDMITRLQRGKNFQAAMMMTRQLESSLFDFLLHSALYQGGEVDAMAERLRTKLSVIAPPDYNRFHHSFTHIFSGGYAAGYYSYKWAEVLSAHLYLLMQQKDQRKILGDKYRDLILSFGGSRSMNEMFYELTGVEKDPKKLLELYGLAS